MKLAIFKKFVFKKKESDFILKHEFTEAINSDIEIQEPIKLPTCSNELLVADNKSLMQDSQINLKFKSLMSANNINLLPVFAKLGDSLLFLNKIFRNEFDRKLRFAINSKYYIGLEAYLSLAITLMYEQKTIEISIPYIEFQNITNPYFEITDNVQFYNIEISPIKYYKLLKKLENSCTIIFKL